MHDFSGFDKGVKMMTWGGCPLSLSRYRAKFNIITSLIPSCISDMSALNE